MNVNYAKDFLDTISNLPPPYTQSTISHEPSEIAGRQTHSRSAPSNTSNEAEKSGQFRSYLARNENQRSQQGPEDALASNVRAARSDRTRTNLRVMHEERRKLREELYQNSLLSFEQDTDSGKANNPILQRGSSDVREVYTLCTQYQFDIGDQEELQDLLGHTLTAVAEHTLTSGAWLFYQTYLLRNAILAVYHNCRRLQTAELAGPWFSMLVLRPPSNKHSRVVTLSRVKIECICEVVKNLSYIVTNLQDFNSETSFEPRNIYLTILCIGVHELYQGIFHQLGLQDFFSHVSGNDNISREIGRILSGRSSGGSAYFENIFSQWWCATRALDAGLVAYESGHVSNVDQTSKINLGTFKIGVTAPESEHSRFLQYIPRGLKCLAGFFHEHDVWVLAMEQASSDLYLATDIETFADVWGPVWKVADQSQPELIAKYNVRGGSIIPWPSDPDVHPNLGPNERLCHWKSNDEYIHPYDEDSTDVGMSSILASCPESANHSGSHAFRFIS